MEQKILRYLISFSALLLVAIRAIYPDLKFDQTSLYLYFLAVIVLLIPDLTSSIARIKKIKKGDFEIELDQQLKALANETLEEEKSTEEDKNYLERNFDFLEFKDKVQDYLKDPRGGLIAVSVEIESTLRKIATEENISTVKSHVPLLRLSEVLADEGYIPFGLPILIRDFWKIRNQIIHIAEYQLTEDKFYKLLDLGVRILELTRKHRDLGVVIPCE